MLNKRLRAGGGKLVLCNLSPTIEQIMEIIKGDQLFDLRRQEPGQDAGDDATVFNFADRRVDERGGLARLPRSTGNRVRLTAKLRVLHRPP